ncbi:hypothetical protein QOZ80_2AG0144940 [Eleusine coracana subsp. coracana]|nr:hypothetical protein QOZ80_2AG0144940 [Eleusine coracana subsp. coracana]
MLEGRGSKMASAGGGDRLSALPDVVLEHVISFLPSVDAVRTCVLARRWRGLWLSMPSLRVDGESVKECHRFLDHLLLLRGHAPIDTCDLSFDDFSKRDVPYLNLWIRYAVMCRVRVLRFYADWRRGERLPVGDLPLITNTLTRLRLHGVDLGERTTHFSGCPVLEELKLTECSHMTAEITSNSLKRLRLTDSYFSCLDYRARISTPNLVKLRIYNLGGHFPLLKSMPSLVTSFIWE